MNRPILLAVLSLTVGISCDDTVFPNHGAPEIAEGDGAPEEYTPDYDGVVALMNDHCVVCHGEGRGNRFVFPDDLSNSIVTDDPYYVIPCDAQASRLWRVLTGETRDDDFGRMPLAGLLPPTHIAHVAEWIDAGADVGEGPPDDDGDGFLAGIDDCDDSNAAIFPEADELCNELDDDCDGEVDEFTDEQTPTDAGTFYADFDGDGFGDADDSVLSCVTPERHVADNTDCDDLDADAAPGGTELCDGRDNDCDGTVDNDDATDAGTYYIDGDTDGFGDDATAFTSCNPASTAVEFGGDCNDADGAFYPTAPETDCADPNDYNCDGSNGAEDNDGDGEFACEECDDDNIAVNSTATETCDGIDNNCDGDIDEAGATGELTYFIDADADGSGDSSATGVTSCSAPAGFVVSNDDCDDDEALARPGGTEICDGIDNDCNDTVDDAAGLPTWFVDADGDAHGHPTSTMSSCTQPPGTATVNDDCNDDDGTVFPGATEIQDGKDQDCDGAVDEDFYTYTHSADIQPIWNSSCGGCHVFSSGLSIANTDGYSALINVQSTQVGGMKRVIPGSPEDSYLWHKLVGTQSSVGGFGGKMPKGGSLSQDELDIVETWILEGAPP